MLAARDALYRVRSGGGQRGPGGDMHGAVARGPTGLIAGPIRELTLGGTRFVFMLAPGTEAPSEFLIYLPDHKALCAAEDATHNLHNLLTLRGAVVRDPHAWSNYLTETIDLFGDEVEVVFASSPLADMGPRPRGRLPRPSQRDLYALPARPDPADAEQGPMVGPQRSPRRSCCRRRWVSDLELARLLRLGQPQRESDLPSVTSAGSTATPPTFWEHPPVEKAKRMSRRSGGADAVVDKARAAFDAGDYRWAAELLNHVVFAQPDHSAGL